MRINSMVKKVVTVKKKKKKKEKKEEEEDERESVSHASRVYNDLVRRMLLLF